MNKRKIILLACLGLAFTLSFTLNNKTFAGFTDPTGPPGEEGSNCTMQGEYHPSFSQMDGPPTVGHCFDCETYEKIPIYDPGSGMQIGVLHKRNYKDNAGLVQSCKYSNIQGSSCTNIFWVGSVAGCDDYYDYTDTGTDTNTF